MFEQLIHCFVYCQVSSISAMWISRAMGESLWLLFNAKKSNFADISRREPFV
jgi:hypothetical protein